MELKTIVNDFQNGKKLNDSLAKNQATIEELILGILRENENLKKRIEQNEETFKNYLIKVNTPW